MATYTSLWPPGPPLDVVLLITLECHTARSQNKSLGLGSRQNTTGDRSPSWFLLPSLDDSGRLGCSLDRSLFCPALLLEESLNQLTLSPSASISQFTLHVFGWKVLIPSPVVPCWILSFCHLITDWRLASSSELSCCTSLCCLLWCCGSWDQA